MFIVRAISCLVILVLSSQSFAKVDADHQAQMALTELQAAQVAYELAAEQFQLAQANLDRANAHAISVGAIPNPSEFILPIVGVAVQPESAVLPADAAKKVVDRKEDEPSFWVGWKKSVRFGFNSTAGNTENANLNLQFHTKRQSKKSSTKFDSEYRFATRDGSDTQNRLDIDLRHEWLAQGDSKIGWWANASFEADEFQDWDYRAQAHAGISYQFIKDKKTDLKARTGFGGSQTFGGSKDDFRPEALVTGIDLRHRFNETMNIEAGTEYFVDVSKISRDRFNNHAKWNILLDKESNMTLQFKLTHKYDSEPGGTKANNDLYFDVTVGWQF